MEKNKVVTIRGVNNIYYNQFQSFTKLLGRSQGKAFSEVIKFHKKPVPAILGTSKMKQMFQDSFISNLEYLEIIENLDEIKITKTMLIEAGKDVKYLFHNISKLILDETVDNDVILQHIYRITNSKVILKGSISKLLLYSLVRSPMSNSFTNEGELREITIRNVNAIAYDEFVSSCQLHNQSVGEGLNELFSYFIPEAELMFIVINEVNQTFKDLLIISNIDMIEISEQDLKEIEEKKILFHRVQELKFNGDITKDSFITKIAGIYNCKHVNIPEFIPKLLTLSRIKNFPNIN